MNMRAISTTLFATLATIGLLTGCANTSASGTSGPQDSRSVRTHQHVVTLRKSPVPNAVEYKMVPITTSIPSEVSIQKHIYYTNRVLVVSFHDMSSHLNSPFNMSPILFAEDLQALRQYHFNVISNQQYVGWLQHQNSVPANAVMLTFDDGYESMYTHAFPTLLHYHMPGTFFDIVHAQDVQFPGFLSWSQVQFMAHHGMTIESHTYNLHYEVNVMGQMVPAFNTPYYHGTWQSGPQYFQRDYQDFRTARLLLQQHLGVPVNEIAWPYGYGNDVAYLAAKAAGYQYFFTTAPGIDTLSTSHWYMKRIDVGLAKTPEQMVNHMLQTAGVPLRLVPIEPATSSSLSQTMPKASSAGVARGYFTSSTSQPETLL